MLARLISASMNASICSFTAASVAVLPASACSFRVHASTPPCFVPAPLLGSDHNARWLGPVFFFHAEIVYVRDVGTSEYLSTYPPRQEGIYVRSTCIHTQLEAPTSRQQTHATIFVMNTRKSNGGATGGASSGAAAGGAYPSAAAGDGSSGAAASGGTVVTGGLRGDRPRHIRRNRRDPHNACYEHNVRVPSSSGGPSTGASPDTSQLFADGWSGNRQEPQE